MLLYLTATLTHPNPSPKVPEAAQSLAILPLPPGGKGGSSSDRDPPSPGCPGSAALHVHTSLLPCLPPLATTHVCTVIQARPHRVTPNPRPPPPTRPAQPAPGPPQVEALRPLSAGILSERRAVRPFGLLGGQPAEPGLNLLVRGAGGRKVNLGESAGGRPGQRAHGRATLRCKQQPCAPPGAEWGMGQGIRRGAGLVYLSAGACSAAGQRAKGGAG